MPKLDTGIGPRPFPLFRRGRLRAAALLVLAAPAVAQDEPSSPPALQFEGCVTLTAEAPRSLGIDSCVRSALDRQDPVLEGTSIHYEDFALDVPGGTAVLIEMDAVPPPAPAEGAEEDENAPDPLDTYLEVLSAAGETLARNDDRPNSLNSTLLFVPSRPGRYTVRARSFSNQTGEFLLRARTAPLPPPPGALSGTVAGRLEQSPPELAAAGLNGVRYTFEGEAGERVRLDLRSEMGQVALQLQDAAGRQLDSRYGDGNLELVAVLPSRGAYLVQIAADQLVEAQTFTLALSRSAPPAGPVAATPLTREEPVGGDLGLDSAAAMRGASRIAFFYEIHSLDVQAGETLAVELESGDFTPYLEAGTESVLGFAAAATARGMVGAAGTRAAGIRRAARLVLRPERSGIVLLRVRGSDSGIGRYTLRVVTRRTATAPQAD